MIRPPPRPPLFPYTTRFRSVPRAERPPHDVPDGQLPDEHLGRTGCPVADRERHPRTLPGTRFGRGARRAVDHREHRARSEEHTSELQSLAYLVCRLLLEKKE